ncbi:unnamed protein product [Tuber aestivum]|uniref:non-specific serine/threonine protein kinase n=1 Tax=Tuber aestivum TaxID=59557 RepID=A0A292Q0H2_9PEZI|nr:unnamed protein product [Tuber aestivum]
MPPTYTDGDLAIPPYRQQQQHHQHQQSQSQSCSQQQQQQRPHRRHDAHKPDAEHRLGQYNIIKTLGEGSFGKVKLAVHQVSGQKVALKIISRKKLNNRDMAGRVEREIAYLQLLRHPHIIKLYTVITTPNDIIMVIEYAGGELFEYIVTNGKMTEDSARRFFQQIICAVEYCHRHKIVHRDLKPENLLLDDYLNVKIADFGLSNIMTDGNFLKTSCGSPNYAAPEVISGKLYAGPEVDVWSCGVILYVLLCGRLPFDDDYIPTLFKKIGQGNYSIPHFLSSEARNLIQRMLVVNPLSRITVADIRQDPWFNKGLPEYLRPPPEEFFNTGVDFSRLPTWKSIERGPAERLKGELHEAVVGKLGSTMGYAKDDVQDALNKEEPSAIKDAYMIVRENQMMMRDSRLSNAHNIKNFLAQSPPAWNSYLPSSPRHTPNSQAPNSPSFNAQTPQRTASPFALPGTKDGLGIAGVPEDVATPGDVGPSPSSSISILPTSLPAYHKAYMSGAPPPPSPAPSSPQITPQQTRRGLRPINTRIQSSTNRIEGLTPLPPGHAQHAKRPRPTRWQFGIRSRNSPLEAVGCIYRALRKLGAEWELEECDDDEVGENGEEGDGNDSDSGGETPGEEYANSDTDSASSHEEEADSQDTDSDWQSRQHSRHNNVQQNSKNKRTQTVPTDPWIIHCRWRKSPLTSTATTKRPNYPPANPIGEEGLYVHMEIQLYQLEHNFYLVDFKCAGYERLGKRKKVGFLTELGGDGRGVIKGDDGKEEEVAVKGRGKGKGKSGNGGEGDGGDGEKEVSSPFPFLELASRLIIQLAEATE